ncbi:MAG: mechanosensitive ion channel family protein [Anaerolineales bacterium]
MEIGITSILNATFLGNTLGQWTGLAFVLVLSVVISRVAIWRLSRSVKFFIKSDESKLDDLLVDAFDSPLFFLLVLCGVWLGFNILSVSAGLAALFQRIWQFLFTLTMTWMISRLYGVFHVVYVVDYFYTRRGQLDKQLLDTLNSGVRTVIWVMGGLLAINSIGYDITAVIAGLAIAGLAVALAAQDTVANLFGGVTIFAQQPFKLGEVIEVGDIRGEVMSIGIRTTRLQDALGQDVVVPNRFFTQNPVRNISSRMSYVIETQIPLSFKTSPAMLEKFMDNLRAHLTRHPDLSENVTIGVHGFERDAITVACRAEIRKFDPADRRFANEQSKQSAVRSEVHLLILREMETLGLSFASRAEM